MKDGDRAEARAQNRADVARVIGAILILALLARLDRGPDTAPPAAVASTALTR